MIFYNINIYRKEAHMIMEKKRGRGRPSQDKMMRPYTLDRKIVEFVDSLPDGDRSRFVNRLLLQGTEIEKLAGKYYTYVLLRPDGSVFYVGKGQGNRIDQHEEEARKGGESHKCNVIRKIWSEGGEVIKQKIAFFDDDEDACQLEVLLIDFFGRDTLTNRTNGGESGNYCNHPRLAVSFSGVPLELAYDWLAELGETDPSPERVKTFIRDTFEQAAKKRGENIGR
jgi:hypothetical protein